MTTPLFVSYITSINTKMANAGRRIVLLVDNAPVHCDVQFSNLKLIFLPANTTAGTQPLDAGIIRQFKYFYRRYLLKYLVVKVNWDSEGASDD